MSSSPQLATGLGQGAGAPAAPAVLAAPAAPGTPKGKGGLRRTPSFLKKNGGKSQNIVVGVRIRPMNKGEKKKKEKVVWKCSASTVTEVGGDGKQYSFDHVFAPGSTNHDVYEKLGAPIASNVMLGFNGICFAYGQTSSGKTHTLTGNADDPGMMVLAVQDIFMSIYKAKDAVFLVRASYLEIYNETLRDLLDPAPDVDSLKVTEGKNGEPKVQGLKEVAVRSVEHVLELIASGERNRHFATTNMNAHSSRSHVIFKLVVEMGTEMSEAQATSGTAAEIAAAAEAIGGGPGVGSTGTGEVDSGGGGHRGPLTEGAGAAKVEE